jgi:ribosomal protein S18 acetylase RimI-like enzyme
MDRRHDNPPIDCRFLSEADIPIIHQAFQEAFSDYMVTFQLTPAQLERHILLNGVDMNHSVGCFDGDRMVGFTMNGFGDWKGRPTIYDAGTGVIPGFRGRGLSRAMFDLIFPLCERRGIEQCLLEVIAQNAPAVRLYDNLGFQTTRNLLIFEAKDLIKTAEGVSEGVEVREIKVPDWPLLSTFWDGEASWQNSIDAVSRSRDVKKILGAYMGGECVGYVIFSTNLGRVAQIAVSKLHRGRGVGSALLLAVQANGSESGSIQIVNVDERLAGAAEFFRNRGFTEILRQYEMVKFL